jgi:hypothetical protein
MPAPGRGCATGSFTDGTGLASVSAERKRFLAARIPLGMTALGDFAKLENKEWTQHFLPGISCSRCC